jgi:hypothetical protein
MNFPLPPFTYANQAKALVVSEGYHMVITASIQANRMTRQMEENTGL